MTHNNLLSALPAELRRMIWEFVLGDARLWVRPYRCLNRDLTVARRLVSDVVPRGEYAPHPLFRVNHFIADEVQQLWQHRFDGGLHVDFRLGRFPPHLFGGVTHLTLTMEQATEVLQVTIPHIRDYSGPWHIPSTELVLAQGLAIQHLEIYWNMSFFLINPFVRDPEHIQAALIRLQFFRRSFQVTIHFRAHDPYRQQPLLYTGTIRDHGTTNLRRFSFHHNEDDTAPSPQVRARFQQSIRQFGWTPQHQFTEFSPQYRATVGAHPYHDYQPLGALRPFFGSSIDYSEVDWPAPLVRRRGPVDVYGPEPEFSARRDDRREWDE